MYHHFSSMLAVLLVVIAGVTVLIMLEMNNSKADDDKDGKSGWFAVHRFLGYLFLVLFAIMLAYMVFSAGGLQTDMSLAGPSMPAIIVALLLIPLIMIKVAIARRRSHISTKLILLGTAIFGLSFGLTAITAKYYASAVDSQYLIPYSGENEQVIVEPGQNVMARKCSKCHSLERIYISAVSDWLPTVRKMAERDYPNITNADVKQIVEYLNQQKERSGSDKAERARQLISSKCGICHSLDKVYGPDLNEHRWSEIINDMIRIVGDPDYLSEQEKQDIVSFLSSRPPRPVAPPTTPPPVEPLAAKKCGSSAGCHAFERVLRVQPKTEEEWTETVSSMIEITGDPNYLTNEEKQEIIKFLIRPQKEKPIKGEDAARPKSSSVDHPLVSRKCGHCHDLERVHQADKTKEEWADTVSNMAENSGDQNYLSEQEKQDIITIISSWEVMK
jgi:mono/diheme cytochrome c family protein